MWSAEAGQAGEARASSSKLAKGNETVIKVFSSCETATKERAHATFATWSQLGLLIDSS